MQNAPAYTLIDSAAGFRSWLADLKKRGVRECAVDFEGESNLHRYGLHICLMQVFDGSACYLVDTLAINDPAVIGRFTQDEGILKLMYDPTHDFTLVRNVWNQTIRNVVDLRKAAELLDHEQLSLMRVLARVLDMPDFDKKKYQRANWSRRPLSDDLLRYAAHDVLHLFALRDALIPRLVAEGKLSEFMTHTYQIQRKTYHLDGKNRYLKLKNAKNLNRSGRAYLRVFHALREEIAERVDTPPNNVIENATLIELARRPPVAEREWRAALQGSRLRPAEIIRFMEAGVQVQAELKGERHEP